MDDSGVCCCFPSCDISQLLLIPFIDSTVPLVCVYSWHMWSSKDIGRVCVY